MTGLDAHHVKVGSEWNTGNVLFRSPQRGFDFQPKTGGWARAADSAGRLYLIWVADHPRKSGLVIQPLDSHYCFEVSRA